MNLPDAIEHLRAMHTHDTLFANADPDYARNAQALAVCLEVLAKTPIDTTKSAPPLTPEERKHVERRSCSCGKGFCRVCVAEGTG